MNIYILLVTLENTFFTSSVRLLVKTFFSIDAVSVVAVPAAANPIPTICNSRHDY